MNAEVISRRGEMSCEFSVVPAFGGYWCAMRITRGGRLVLVKERLVTTLAGVVDFFGNGHLARELYDELGIDYEG